MPRYSEKLVVLHVPFIFLRLKNMHVNLSFLNNNLCKSTRSNIIAQQLEEHAPGIIKNHCIVLHYTVSSIYLFLTEK